MKNCCAQSKRWLSPVHRTAWGSKQCTMLRLRVSITPLGPCLHFRFSHVQHAELGLTFAHHSNIIPVLSPLIDNRSPIFSEFRWPSLLYAPLVSFPDSRLTSSAPPLLPRNPRKLLIVLHTTTTHFQNTGNFRHDARSICVQTVQKTQGEQKAS